MVNLKEVFLDDRDFVESVTLLLVLLDVLNDDSHLPTLDKINILCWPFQKVRMAIFHECQVRKIHSYQ